MHSFGHTRSASHPTHLLHTPDTFVRIPLPGLERAQAVVHASPTIGASFAQYTVEFESGGSIAPASSVQRFLYVLDGTVTVTLDGESHSLPPNGYACLPPAAAAVIHAPAPARISIIEKPYQLLPGQPPPAALFALEPRIDPRPLGGDPDLRVRSLLPTDLAYDFAVNTMEYLPGASLTQVEVHIMEHGLLMLSGGGIYRLADQWYPVAAGDFIWMAPYCPQWFAAVGKAPAKYLIYKDWNRSPID